jgi:hypothetical protein
LSRIVDRKLCHKITILSCNALITCALRLLPNASSTEPPTEKTLARHDGSHPAFGCYFSPRERTHLSCKQGVENWTPAAIIRPASGSGCNVGVQIIILILIANPRNTVNHFGLCKSFCAAEGLVLFGHLIYRCPRCDGRYIIVEYCSSPTPYVTDMGKVKASGHQKGKATLSCLRVTNRLTIQVV